MKQVAQFETMRFWLTGKNVLVLALVVVALTGMIVYNTIQDQNYWGRGGNYMEELLDEDALILTELEFWRTELKSAEISANIDESVIKPVQEGTDFFRLQHLYNYQQQLLARDYTPEHGRERLALNIQRDQHIFQGLEQGYQFLDSTRPEVLQQISVNEHLLQEEIRPLNSPYEMTGTNFLYQLTSYPWILIIIMALALLNIDIFSGDIDGGAYKVYFSQPIHRQKIYAVKYLIYFANSLIALGGLVILATLATTLVKDFGDINYPIYYFSESFTSLTSTGNPNTFTFLPWFRYMLQALPMYFLLCCFIITVIGFASLLLNNTTNTLSFLICLVFLDTVSRTMFANQAIFYMVWPFTALAVNSVMQGGYSLSALTYSLELSILTIGMLGAGLWVLKKRDLTGGVGQ